MENKAYVNDEQKLSVEGEGHIYEQPFAESSEPVVGWRPTISPQPTNKVYASLEYNDDGDVHIYEKIPAANRRPKRKAADSSRIPQKVKFIIYKRRKMLTIIGIVAVVLSLAAISLALAFGLTAKQADTVPKPDDRNVTDAPTTTKISHTSTTIATTTTEPPQPVKYARWSTWGSWSTCSISCGNGGQRRMRVCLDDGADVPCSGSNNQTFPCSIGQCPDCNRKCPSGGTPNAACSMCVCAHNATIKVITPNKVPITGASVIPVDLKTTVLGYTDAKGQLKLVNICPSQQIILQKKKFSDAESTVLSPDPIVMHPIEQLTIVKEPEDVQAFVGESVEFSCQAKGFPAVKYFEWFKDNEMFDKSKYSHNVNLTVSKLKIDNAATSDNGQIRCRANGEVSSIYSQPATLVVKSNDETFCDTVPLSKHTELPYDCVHSNNTGKGRFYDVGSCAEIPCRMAGNMTAEHHCGATEFITEIVQCQGYTLTVSKVLECGCVGINTYVLNKGQTFMNRDKHFRLYINAFSHQSPDMPLQFGDVYVDGDKIGITNLYGKFHFPITNGEKRFVIMLKDSLLNQLVDTVKVVKVDTSMGSMFVDMPMLSKPPATSIQSSQTNTVTAFSKNNKDLINLILPANSFYKNGQQYNGKVNASVTFIDPEIIESMDMLAGELSNVDEEGEPEMIRSFGMWIVDINDDEGNELTLDGDVEVSISNEFFGASIMNTDMTNTKVKLWSLSSTSGRWQTEDNLHINKSSYAARPFNSDDSSFFAGNITLRGRAWYNIDRSGSNFCFVKVQVYAKDPTTNTGEPIMTWNDNNHNSMPIIRVLATGLRDGNAITGHQSYYGGLKSRRNCILSLCSDTQRDKFEGYVSAEGRTGQDNFGLLNATVNTVHNSNPNKNVKLELNSRGKVIKATVEHITNEGPIFHSKEGDLACLNPNSYKCRTCSATSSSNDPECLKCDYNICNRKAADAYYRCLINDNKFEPHFQFFKSNWHRYHYTVCMTDMTTGCSTEQGDLAWHFDINKKVEIFFIKIKVRSNRQETVVRAISKTNSEINQTYGLREDVTVDQYVCLEFKPYTQLQDKGETVVEIHVHDHINCHGHPKTRHLEDIMNGTDSIPLPVKFKYGKYPSYGRTAGIYYGQDRNIAFDDINEINDLRAKTERECRCPDGTQCRPGQLINGDGVGLEIHC